MRALIELILGYVPYLLYALYYYYYYLLMDNITCALLYSDLLSFIIQYYMPQYFVIYVLIDRNYLSNLNYQTHMMHAYINIYSMHSYMHTNIHIKLQITIKIYYKLLNYYKKIQ